MGLCGNLTWYYTKTRWKTFTLQAEGTFSWCELSREKAAPADNRSIFSRACLKSVTRFASKINRQVCRQMAQVSRE